MKQSTEDKIKSAMKRLSNLIEQYYKEHKDRDRGVILRHYASYTHGVSYMESTGCSVISDYITLGRDNGTYNYIDISHSEEGHKLFDTITGGNEDDQNTGTQRTPYQCNRSSE